MRRVLTVPIAIATAAIGLGVVAPTQATASCAGPSITVTGVTATPVEIGSQTQENFAVVPGQRLTVDGTSFFVGCADQGGGGPGCSGPTTEKMHADSDVPLVLKQGGRSWTLGTTDADGGDSYATQWKVELPTELQPGSATLMARSAELQLTIE